MRASQPRADGYVERHGVKTAPFEILAKNVNAPGDPAVTVSSSPVQNAIKTPNTRTFDIGFAMEDPNIRVPAFAHSFIFDHGLPGTP
jgi:hypothetical protein